MKQVKLLELELTNYRNIEHEIYKFGGESSKIVGENRIGKTNTLEAIYFLLTNYLLDGSSELTALKPLVDTKRAVRVKGTFLVDDKELTIEKVYAEDWVKTRGTAELVLKGHYEDYFFNGIKQAKAKDYYDLLNEYFGVRNDEKGEIDTIQTLTNPLYLGNLGDSKDWTNLRTFIIKLIGDVSDEEVYKKEPSTLIIKEDMEKALGKVEQVKKLYANEIKELENHLLTDDSNIELLEKTPKPTDDEIAIARKGIEEHDTKIATLRANTSTDNATKVLEEQLFDLKKVILTENTKEYEAFKASQNNSKENELQGKINEINSKINDLVNKKAETQSKISSAGIKKSYDTDELQRLKSKRIELINEYKSLKAQLENIVVETLCPTCGQELPPEKVEEAKANVKKQLESKINANIEEGKRVASKIAELEEEIFKIEQGISCFNEEIDHFEQGIFDLRKELKELDYQLQELRAHKLVFTESKHLTDLRAQAKELEQRITESKAKFNTDNSLTYELIQKEEEAKAPFTKVISDKDYYDRQMVVLEELRKNKTIHSQALANAEQKREALNLFIYTRLRLLDEHLEKVFGNIKFQLIKENINGGYDPVCKPFIFNIDKNESTKTLWKSGSKSEKVITGIAIAECIKKALLLPDLPYLFDEGGEISTDTFNTKFKTNAQIICVKVEDNITRPTIVKI